MDINIDNDSDDVNDDNSENDDTDLDEEILRSRFGGILSGLEKLSFSETLLLYLQFVRKCIFLNPIIFNSCF